MADEKPTSKFVITMSGNQWGTVQFGIVEYLRRHPRIRALTAILGLLWVLGWIASTSGFKWHLAMFPAVSTFFVTPTLLWFAVVSGPEFSLTFKAPEPPKPPSLPSPPDEPDAVIDPEGFGIKSLNKSYTATEGYGRSSFRWAMFAFIFALVSGSANVFLALSAIHNDNRYIGPSLLALTLTMFLTCCLLLLRSMLMFRRATKIHDSLLDFQKAIAAMRYQERLRQARLPAKKGPASAGGQGTVERLLAQFQSPTGTY